MAAEILDLVQYVLSKPAVCQIKDTASELNVCYQQSCMKPIYLYPLEFDDSGGKMCLTLRCTLLLQSLGSVQKSLIIERVLLVFQRTP